MAYYGRRETNQNTAEAHNEMPDEQDPGQCRDTPTGGYEHEFLDKIPDKYKCMICHRVQKEATIISCCSKHYCNSCLEEWFRQQPGRSKRCPHCRSKSFSHFVNKERVQDINELRVYCSKRDHHGCQWKGKLEDLEEHVDSECDYTSVDCPNGCNEEMMRKELEDHQEKDCLLRPFECPFCGLEDTYHAITGECGQRYDHCDIHDGHYDECEEFPLECPNECDSETIKRKDMDDHLEECPLQPVDCPFEEVGCTTNVVHKDMKDHISSSDHNHLMLVMEAFKEIKMKNVQLEAENETLQKKFTQLKDRLTKIEGNISTPQLYSAHSKATRTVPTAHYPAKLVRLSDIETKLLQCCFDLNL